MILSCSSGNRWGSWAFALVGVTQVMGEATVDGVSAILGAGVTIVSIALGVVLGLSVGEWGKSLIRR